MSTLFAVELAFTKLFNKIVTSSVWSEDDKTRIVWITMLALADRNGYVAAALPGLADVSRVSLEDAKAAILRLEAPDEYSRTQVENGRRLLKVEGGWQIVTYALHRKLLSIEERKQYKAEWAKQDRRQKRGQRRTDVDIARTTVTQAEAEAEAEAEKNVLSLEKKEPKKERVPPSFMQVREYFDNEQDASDFYNFYESNGWKVGRNPMKSWRGAAGGWKSRNAKSQPPTNPKDDGYWVKPVWKTT